MNKRVSVEEDGQAVGEPLRKLPQMAGYEVVLAAGGLETGVRRDLERTDLLITASPTPRSVRISERNLMWHSAPLNLTWVNWRWKRVC
jgi:hypothetical protein